MGVSWDKLQKEVTIPRTHFFFSNLASLCELNVFVLSELEGMFTKCSFHRRKGRTLGGNQVFFPSSQLEHGLLSQHFQSISAKVVQNEEDTVYW